MASSHPILRCGDEVVFGELVDPAQAVERWRGLRQSYPRTGLWPLIVGFDSIEWYELEQLCGPSDVAESEGFLREVERFDLDTFFASWIEEYLHDDVRGSWREIGYGNRELSIPHVHQTVFLASVPAIEPWHIARFFPQCFSNYLHDDATPLVHAAMLRRWHRDWGAEPACLAYATLELETARKPSSRPEAFELAREQWCYAPDVVHERYDFHAQRGWTGDSLEDLAEVLMKSDVWWFWWD